MTVLYNDNNVSGVRHLSGSPTPDALSALLNLHYLRRRPPISEVFEWWENDGVRAVMTLGVPASRHMQVGACPSCPENVLELNRLWVREDQPKNTASWFVARSLALAPPRIILSYADTAVGHLGWVYRACNFYYAGWTDMERKTPRFDYLVPGRHTRDAFRYGAGVGAEKVRRRPKVKYWTITGSRRERRELKALCQWPRLDWKVLPPPMEHQQYRANHD